MACEERLDLRGQHALHVTRSLGPLSFPAERFASDPRPARLSPAYQEPMPLQSKQPGQALGFAEDRSCGLRSMGECCAPAGLPGIAVRLGGASKPAENRRGLRRRALPLSPGR